MYGWQSVPQWTLCQKLPKGSRLAARPQNGFRSRNSLRVEYGWRQNHRGHLVRNSLRASRLARCPHLAATAKALFCLVRVGRVRGACLRLPVGHHRKASNCDCEEARALIAVRRIGPPVDDPLDVRRVVAGSTVASGPLRRQMFASAWPLAGRLCYQHLKSCIK